MMKTRVALVRPNVDVLRKFSKPVENLAIGYLATALRQAGHEAIMLDGMLHGWSVEESVSRILEVTPQIVGFTVVLQHFPPLLRELIVALRAAGYEGLVLIGGHSVSFFPESVLRAIPEVDAVVRGEGERSICSIAESLAQRTEWRDAPGVCWMDRAGGYHQNRVERVSNLNELGDPARDLTTHIMGRDGLVAVSSSRGCYARCTFCSVPRFYGLSQGRALASGSWLARDVAGTVAEVTALHERFGTRELLFVDDEFFGGSELGLQRAISLGKALEELALPVEFALSCRAENVHPEALAQLQRGGLRHVFVGIETGSNQALKLYGKGHSSDQNREAVRIINGLGLSFQPGFMLFNHRSTLTELKTSLDFLLEIGECKPATLNSSADPHFGTPLVADMARNTLLVDRGLSMTSGFIDPQVAAVRHIATLTADAFRPYMELLAGLRSAVTYEWRRRVPHRLPPEERLLDSFEDTVNRAFSEVVIDAVDQALSHPGREPERLIEDGQDALVSVEARLTLGRALVIAQLERAEGGISYTSQLDLIAGTRA